MSIVFYEEEDRIMRTFLILLWLMTVNNASNIWVKLSDFLPLVIVKYQIGFQSLLRVLDLLNYKYHSQDFYISPDYSLYVN